MAKLRISDDADAAECRIFQAACHAAEHDLAWEDWELAGGISKVAAYRAMANRAARPATADVAWQVHDQDAEPSEHVDWTLAPLAHR